jgi:2-keto-4-pentenoate hydratase/2-oxohepta-3-ene-1,7-dioic acid hydratase in catechol pathway
MLPAPHLVEVQTKVNGELRQKSAIDQLIFDIPTLIETISKGITIQSVFRIIICACLIR